MLGGRFLHVFFFSAFVFCLNRFLCRRAPLISSHRYARQPMYACLAVANDASSAINLDAFYAMQSLTGYPGQIGDYDECAKVVLFDESVEPVMTTHHCLTGTIL